MWYPAHFRRCAILIALSFAAADASALAVRRSTEAPRSRSSAALRSRSTAGTSSLPRRSGSTVQRTQARERTTPRRSTASPQRSTPPQRSAAPQQRTTTPRSSTAQRSTIPRRSTPATPRSTTVTPQQRSTNTSRDWAYPRTSPRSFNPGTSGRSSIPRSTGSTVTPGTTYRRGDGSAVSPQQRIAPGTSGLGRSSTNLRRGTGRDRGFINVTPPIGGTARDWARSPYRPRGVLGDASRRGFAHRLDRHWDNDYRRNLARRVRTRLPGYTYARYFRPGWWQTGWAGPSRWGNYWGWRGWRPYHWYRNPSWGSLVGFFAGFNWGANSYVPYYYGDSIYYQDNYVYQNGQPLVTADVYAQQAINLASVQVPEPPPLPTTGVATAADSWQPLGVFALVTDEDADPDTFLQLAVSSAGYISGTYYNRLTEQSLPVQGSVDRTTQRAAWRIGESTNTVMEAGIYNLTQDQAPILVHFGTDTTQNYLLVRMEQPTETETTYQWSE